jgi:hypothetical protein
MKYAIQDTPSVPSGQTQRSMSIHDKRYTIHHNTRYTINDTRYTINVVFCFVLVLTGCKKVSFTNDIGNPVFSVNLNIDGLRQTITAGVPVQQYLYTNVKQEKESLLSTADFGVTTCQDSCTPQLRFEFRQHNTGSTNIGSDSLRITNNLPFYTLQRSAITNNYLLNARVRGEVYKNILWTFEPGTTLSAPVFESTFTDVGTRQIMVRGTTDNGIICTTTIPIALDTFVPTPIKAVIRLQQLTAERRQASVLLPTIVTSTQSFNIIWSNGSTEPIISEVNRSSYAVTLSDSKGQQSTARLDSVRSLTAPLQSIEVDVKLDRVPISNPLLSNSVAIQWKDPSGALWRSDLRQQPSGHFFRILSIQPYINNEKGQRTQRMEIAFSCTLFNVQGQSRQASGNGTIALARPN